MVLHRTSNPIKNQKNHNQNLFQLRVFKQILSVVKQSDWIKILALTILPNNLTLRILFLRLNIRAIIPFFMLILLLNTDEIVRRIC
jgi:hypothetical protein